MREGEEMIVYGVNLLHVLIELLDAHTHTERERENKKEEAIRWDFFYTAENE